MIVPRLVANYEIDTGGRAYELLTALTNARNEIVHPKAQDMMKLNEEQILKSYEHALSMPKRAMMRLQHWTRAANKPLISTSLQLRLRSTCLEFSRHSLEFYAKSKL